MAALTSRGYELDMSPDAFGELRRSDDVADNAAALRERMTEDGYLYLPGLLDRDVVLAARREILEKLASVQALDPSRPLMDAVASVGPSQIKQYGAQDFARELRVGPAVKRMVHEGRMLAFFDHFLGDQARCFDYIWVRTVRPGGSTGCHYDVVYMGRGTHNLYTAWTPVGDVPRTDGSLLILEGSHRLEELKRTYGTLDVDRDRDHNPYGGGWVSGNPPEMRERCGGRWLTADFQAGDVLIFTMFTLHCSLDNQSERVRLSTDTRYQLASEPADERWVGADPPAHDLEKQRARGAA